jgi:hypothetical protein
MVAELDAAVPREGARVHLSQYGGGPDESKVIGNQRGYLRLGVEFLRAAFAPPSPQSPEMIDVNIRYLLTDDSTVGFDWFERREDLPPPSTERTSSRLKGVGIFAVFIIGCILALVGLGTVIYWIAR